MGLQRSLVLVAFQHDIDVNVGRLVQRIELVAGFVGMNLGLQRLHGRLEVCVRAGLDGQFRDDADHSLSSCRLYCGFFFKRYLCSPSHTSSPFWLWIVSFNTATPVVRPGFSSVT